MSAEWRRAKLTPQQRDQIRQRHEDGETRMALAAAFGVSVQTIRNNSETRR